MDLLRNQHKVTRLRRLLHVQNFLQQLLSIQVEVVPQNHCLMGKTRNS